MKKIIIAPDSFKGTLSTASFCWIVKEETLAVYPQCSVICLPVADGAEGTCDCFLLAMEGSVVKIPVKGPYFEPIEATYCMGNLYAALPGKQDACTLTRESLDAEIQGAYDDGLSAVFPINRLALSFEEARLHTPDFVRYTVRNILFLEKALK